MHIFLGRREIFNGMEIELGFEVICFHGEKSNEKLGRLQGVKKVEHSWEVCVAYQKERRKWITV